MSQTKPAAPNSPPERGERERLRIKAQECDAAWQANIERLADARENDVFKYMLLGACIECHSYVTETQIQAGRSFSASSRAAAAGFCLVVLTIVAMLFLPMFVKDFKVEITITTISLLSGVMTTFISTIFFKIYRESQERMERFHNDIREVQRIACGLFLKGITAEAGQRDEERKEILSNLIYSDHSKSSTSGKYQEPPGVAA